MGGGSGRRDTSPSDIAPASRLYRVRLLCFGLVALSIIVSILCRSFSPLRGPAGLPNGKDPFGGKPNSKVFCFDANFDKTTMSTAKNSTAIILHGLGDSSDGWSFLAEQFGPKMPWVRWIFPDAPRQSVTLNMGMVMPAWFDLYGLDPNSKEDEAGLLRSVETVRAIIKKEIDSGIPPERIIVGGFSQGAAISILTGLMSQEKLAGVVSLSGFLTLSKKIKDMKGPFVEDLPLLWCHGTDDPVVRYQWGETSVNFLKNDLGMKNVEFKSYPGMVHSASPQELKDLFVWLNNRIPNK